MTVSFPNVQEGHPNDCDYTPTLSGKLREPNTILFLTNGSDGSTFIFLFLSSRFGADKVE